MCRVLSCLIFLFASLGFLIASSVIYSRSTYKSCGLIFYGHIQSINTIRLPGNTSAIIVILSDIYKVSNDLPIFVESYKIVTTSEEAKKYEIEAFYKNSTAISLYKSCYWDEKETRRNYYLKDFIIFTGGVWQTAVVFSAVSFTISSVILLVLIIEAYYITYKGISIFDDNVRYSSSESIPVYMSSYSNLRESQMPIITVFRDEKNEEEEL